MTERTCPEPRHATTARSPATAVGKSPPLPRPGSRLRRRLAATGAAMLVVASLGGGPLLAVAEAQTGGVLQQSVGGGVQQVAAGKDTGGAGRLNAAPDFSGPGVDKGLSLVGWAKAAALIVGTLALTIGIPVSKALKEAGNHHASGVRAGAMGIGGAILLAGVAGTMLPWLMG